MKFVKMGIIAGFVLCSVVSSSAADEISELKDMVQEMRADYEIKIKTLEDKIGQLEENQSRQVEASVASMREEVKQEIKAESWNAEYVGRYEGDFKKGGLEIGSSSGFSKVTLGGYMDHEFENFENTNSTFDQHRWVINVGAQIGERLRFFSEFEVEHGGPDASGGGEAKIEQAYVDYLIEDWVNFRAGAMLAPFGRANIYHDSDLRDLTSRALVSRDIIPTTWTESGVGFFGAAEPIIGSYEDLELNYEVQVVNGLNDGFSSTGMRGARGSLSSDNNNSKAVVGRLVLSPLLGHEVGFSGYWGKYNTLDDAITGGAVDFLSTWGPLSFEGEYAYFDIDEPDFADTGVTDIAENMQGYYLQANYHFWPKFLDRTFLARSFENPTFTLISRYGWAKIDNDSTTGTGDNEEDRYTLGLNYRPVESWVFKLEHQWNQTENAALERGDNNGWLWSVAMGF